MSFEPLTDRGGSKGNDRAEATEEQTTVDEKESFIFLHCTMDTQTPTIYLKTNV